MGRVVLYCVDDKKLANAAELCVTAGASITDVIST